jgi:aryl-alcohol dehydrogenase-like predicted oxidoreductase
VDSLAENDFRRNLPRFKTENLANNLKIVEEIKCLAEQKKCTPSQLVLAWVLAQSENIVAIPGARKIVHLVENTAAIDVELTKNDVADLEAILKKFSVFGERYHQFGMTMVNL